MVDPHKCNDLHEATTLLHRLSQAPREGKEVKIRPAARRHVTRTYPLSIPSSWLGLKTIININVKPLAFNHTNCHFLDASLICFLIQSFYNESTYANICWQRYCSLPGSSLCRRTPAPRGTSCGDRKVTRKTLLRHPYVRDTLYFCLFPLAAVILVSSWYLHSVQRPNPGELIRCGDPLLHCRDDLGLLCLLWSVYSQLFTLSSLSYECLFYIWMAS